MARRQNSEGSATSKVLSAAAGASSPAASGNWVAGTPMPAPKKLFTYKAKELSHFISDDELERLSETNGGDIGSWFFTLFGAFLGTVPAIIDRAPKVGSISSPLNTWDLVVGSLSIGCLVASVCLGIVWYGRRNRMKKLVAEIRDRKTVTA